MEDIKLYKNIKNHIDEIKIFDTHEHLMYESERRTKNPDFFIFFSQYSSTDLISSGLKLKELRKLHDSGIDIKTKWNIFSPYWEFIKNTTYSKVISIIAKDIYEVEVINLEGIGKITEKMNEFNKIDYYEKLIKVTSRIEFILNDLDGMKKNGIMINEPDKKYFLPVLRIDDLLELNFPEKLLQIEEENDLSIYSFSDFIDFIDKKFEKSKGKIYALKIGAAYSRNLLFENVSYNDAEKNFLKILKLYKHGSHQEGIALREIKDFQDFAYHYCIRKATEFGLPVQIHTGLLEGNDNDIRNSNPTDLTKLLLQYKNTKFDIFHVGYPYTDELISMIKMYPNCYINMCWIAEVSKSLYKDTLNLLIDIIPANKIFGFGGDYVFVEGAYAAQKITREAIAEVLYNKVTQNYFSFEDAVEFAERILQKNPKDVYLNK